MLKVFENITDLSQLDDVATYLISLIERKPTARVFLFDGQMGAGKTTLINKLCLLMKIKEQPSSPTYSIVNTYLSELYGELYHFDFYRLKDEQEAVESGLDELLFSSKICFIEWGEKVTKLLPDNFVRVSVTIQSENQREISVQS